MVDLTSGLAAWLLTYALHSTLLLSGVALILWRVRYAVWLQEWLWRTALLGGVLTATIALLPVPTLRMGPSARREAGSSTHVTLAPDSPTILAHSPGVADPPLKMPVEVAPTLALLWLVGVGAATFRLRWRVRTLHRWVGPRHVVDDALQSQLRDLCLHGGVRGSVRLTHSGSLSSPVVLSAHEICLPTRALTELGTASLHSLLAHEVGHLARRDGWWLWLYHTMEVLFYFQPLNRHARRHLQTCAEFLTDAWAIDQTQAPLSLARCLVQVAGWHIGILPALAVPGMAAGTAPLVERVGRMLDPARQHERPRRGRLLLTLPILLLVGCTAPTVGVASHLPVAASRSDAGLIVQPQPVRGTPLRGPTPTPHPTLVLEWPARGRITEWSSRYHTALDIAAPKGSPVRAAGAGTVVRAGWDRTGYGNVVVLDHGGGYETLYAHLSAFSVEPGDEVAAGELIGAVGASGNSAGPHLHFEVRKKGARQNPARFLPTP